MNREFLIAQIIGLIAIIVLLISFKKNNKEHLLKYQIISSLLYAIQYFFLKAYSGGFINLICALRNYIFNHYKEKKIPLFWLIMILLLLIFFMSLTYIGWISMFPMIGVVMFSCALWIGDLKLIRLIEFLANILIAIYNIYVGAYTALIAVIIEMLGALTAIIQFDILKRKDR